MSWHKQPSEVRVLTVSPLNVLSLFLQICNDLANFGIELDVDRNAAAAGTSRSAGLAIISSAFSRVTLMVVAADEEGEIALQSVSTAGLIPEEHMSTGMEVKAQPLPFLHVFLTCPRSPSNNLNPLPPPCPVLYPLPLSSVFSRRLFSAILSSLSSPPPLSCS